MMLTTGSKLGPYEITGAIGAGGMGEVYRARDTRLGRDVAIKILPQHLTEMPDARQRFEREARAISSLNHPHICTLYDIGHQNGTDFLVMEFVEGETLAKRLEKGPLPTGELLLIGIEVADALDKAHRKGILHRDLRPSNVMLTKSGAKLMDFGLAKAAGEGAAPALESLTQSLSPSARTTPVTQQGTIVGTFQYMAPEQMEGKEADARSDIFSLGAVLYEMATGKRAFEGKTTASVIAAILEREPPAISSVQPMSPPALDRTVKICLAKDPDERFQSAHDVRLQLEWIREAGSQAGVPAPVVTRRKNRERIAWGMAALLLIIAILSTIGYVLRAPHPAPATISQIVPPKNQEFVQYGVFGGAPALSPDGRSVAFAAEEKDGKVLLWIQSLSAAAAQPLGGTEGATDPFWSPDSRYIGFFAGGKLQRIDAAGGPPFVLCDAGPGRGGTWNRDGVILFSPAFNSPLLRVNSSGGAPSPVTTLKGEISNRWPQFLPDGKHFLFFRMSAAGLKDGVYFSSLNGEEPKLLLRSNTNAIYSWPGYLLYALQGSLMAQPFDAGSLKFTGEASPISAHVSPNTSIRLEQVTASNNGILLFNPLEGNSASRLKWFDRTGKELSEIGGPGIFGGPRLSPGGKQLAIASMEPRENAYSIWVYDVARGIRNRRTFGPGSAVQPDWSPDGKTLAFGLIDTNATHIYQKPADGMGDMVPLVAEQGWTETYPSWSVDGRYLVFGRIGGLSQSTNYSVWMLPLFGERKPFLLLKGPFFLDQASLSPDSRWIAYRATESSVPQIYIAPFRNGTGKWEVTTDGGIFPRWRHDGHELFFVSADAKTIMAAEISEQGSSISIGQVKPLFRVNAVPLGALGPGAPYDVTADGQKFIVVTDLTAAEAQPLTLVTNWPALLKKQ